MTDAAAAARRRPIDQDRLTLLLGGHEELAASREPDAVLGALCRLACDMAAARWAAAVVRDRDGLAVRRVRIEGLAPAVADGLRTALLARDPFEGIAAPRRLAAGEGPPGLPAFRAALVVPFGEGGGDGRGWLCVGDPAGQRPFDDQDLAVLDDLAGMAGRMFVLATLRRNSETTALALARQVEDLKRAERRLDIQYAVAEILAHTSSMDEAAPALIEAVCARLGFAFGVLREIDRTHGVLRTAAVWHEPDPALAEFARGSQEQTFTLGSGLTGRAWKTGQPVWFDDGASSDEFRRSADAERAGLHAAAAFPIFAVGETVGVLAFLSRVSRPLDPDMLDMLAAIGSQLGQFVERRRQEAEIEHLNHLYAVLSAVNRLLIQATDREALFSGVCHIAHEQGGFGIALIGTYDPDADVVVPLAGAGPDQAAVWAGRPIPFRSVPPDLRGEVARAVLGREPVFDNDLTSAPERGSERRRTAIALGYRSTAALPLMTGDRVVGVFVLYSRDRFYFTDRIRKLLVEVADDVSFGLNHIENRERLAFLSSYDQLTGLPNRMLFEDRLGQAVIAAGRSGTRVAVLFIDLRRFRDVTDSLGREVGDRILQQFARRLAAVAQNPENLARLEGDRFATFLPDAGDAMAIARRIEHGFASVVAEATQADGEILHLRATVGVAVFPDDGPDVATLVRNCRAALRTAKESGHPYRFYERTINARVADTLRMAGRLQMARERGEFRLNYQPKVAARDGAVRAVEALIRWHDQRRGPVPPVEFIPLLEESGLIGEVGLWVMRQALTDRRRWRARDGKAPRVAVNVSVIQFQLPGFIDGVRALVQEFAEGPGNLDCGLDIEITESLIMTDVTGTIAKLQELRRLGIGIAIDDFGTGHSSLAYLARLPIGSLKIDRSFVRMMVESSESMLIISTIIALAHGLELTVVAEGVETEEQAKLLRLMRCDELQGFLFARPMAADDLVTWLAER